MPALASPSPRRERRQRVIDVLVATVDETRRPGGLHYVRERFEDYRLIVSTSTPWAKGANDALERAERDVLFIDDDVELLPGSLDLIERYYHQADIFGISLIAPNGPQGWYTQSAGHALMPTDDEGGVALHPFDTFATSVPCLVAHAGASCLFLKHEVIKAGVRFPEHWTGVHHEDIYFCLSAWLKGFRVARLPSVAIHYTHPIGAGYTRATKPDFHPGRAENERALYAWMHEAGVPEACERGAIPLGIWTMGGAPWELHGTGHIQLQRQAGET